MHGPQKVSGHSFKEHFPKQISLSFSVSQHMAVTGCCTVATEADVALSPSLLSDHGKPSWQLSNVRSHVPAQGTGGVTQSSSSLIPAWAQGVSSPSFSESPMLRAGGGCAGGWGAPCRSHVPGLASLSWPGHGAHLVLPAHALDIHHLVTPVLLQDLGLLVRQVAQLLGAALEVVVEAAQALPSPDGSFLPTHSTETVSVLRLGGPLPLLLFLPRTTLLLHIQQETPRNLGEKSATTGSYLMGLPFPFPPHRQDMFV